MFLFIFNYSFANLTIAAAAVLISYNTTVSTGAIYITHKRVYSFSIRHHYRTNLASLNVIFTVLNIDMYAVHINIRNYDRIVQYYEIDLILINYL
jgi:hypothetical protein